MITRRHLGIAVAAVIAAGIVPAAAQNYPDKIRIGDVGFGFGKPFGRGLVAIADAKGFIADELKATPVKLEFNYFVNTGPAINEALANQQLDFASYGSVPNTIGKANGLPTRILTAYGATTIFTGVRSDLPIKSIQELKGKRIAVQKATIIHWSLITALKQAGLSEKDVTIVDLKNADQLAAITAGSVDAIHGPSFFLPLRDKGIVRVIYNSAEHGPKATGFGAFLVVDPFQQKYPDVTERVVRGVARAAHWLSDEKSREEAFAIWGRTGVPIEVLRFEYNNVPLKQAFSPLIDEFYAAQYRDVIAFDREQKLIRNDVDFQKWVEPRYLNAALKSLKLENHWSPRNVDGYPARLSN